jgi:hypothetical protein
MRMHLRRPTIPAAPAARYIWPFALVAAMVCFPAIAFDVRTDVDGDKMIGAQDVIHILQVVSGTRSSFDLDAQHNPLKE